MTTSNTTRSAFRRAQPDQSGFTLVEVMVGLVIGMLATLVVMQLFSVFEKQKRTTTGASDSLTNGNIALYRLKHDVQSAGFPLISLGAGYTPFLCAEPPSIGAIPAAAGVVTGISPITIVNGTSDTVTIRYGDAPMGGVPTLIKNIAGSMATLQESSFGCTPGDITLVMNGAACGMSVAAAVGPSSSSVSGTVTLADPTNAAVGGTLACLGVWHEITYSVVNNATGGTLVRQDLGAFPNIGVEPLVADIVNMQAQYGVSAAGLTNTSPNFNQISEWVDATGPWAAPLSVANRNRIKAVRIAIVARDAQNENVNITDPCSSTSAAAPTGLCAWAGNASSPAPTIDLSADSNWQKYRYRVFESIIPLRNVIWAKPYM